MFPSRQAGFAMLDVLVALLLLAMVLTGTCLTLIRSLRASGDALLATRAVDLAADFTEDLRGVNTAAQAEALLAAWRPRVAALLPVAGLDPEEFARLEPLPTAAGAMVPAVPAYVLTLRWRVPDGETRELALPVAYRFMGSPS